MPYAQQDRTPEQIEHVRIITSPEYQIGFARGWDCALAYAGVPNEAPTTPEDLKRLLSTRPTSTERF